MKEKSLIICDDDREFVSRLGGYISRKRDVSFQIACFSDKEKLRAYLSEHEADGMLAGEGWIDDELVKHGCRRLVLTESAGQAELPEGCSAVYKYQAAEDILRQVMLGLELPDGGQTVMRGETELFGVYTPGGWTEGTRLALALTRCLGRDGPALYLGLNEFSPVSRLLGRTSEQDLSDVVYCRRRGRLNEDKLERMVIHLEGYDCIPAPVNPAELAELKEKDIRELVEDVCRIGGYRYVFLDFGGSVFGWLSLFGAAKRNYVIFPATETGMLQQAVYEEFWKSIGAEALLKKSYCAALSTEELRGGRREKMEEFMDELAERLLQSEDESGRS